MPKINETFPSLFACCVMLAKGDHKAGGLLSCAVHWARYAKAIIPGTSGTWIANDHPWWRREAQLSPAQLSRALTKLEKLGLIERRQWWFGGRNILYVRPSQITKNFLAVAKTWSAADAFLGDPSLSGNHGAKCAELGSAKKQISNESSDSAKAGSAVMTNSNNIGNLHTNKHKKLKSALSASPACSSGLGVQGSKVFGKDEFDSTSALDMDSENTNLTVKQLAAIWTACMKAFHSKAAHDVLDFQSIGELAKYQSSLAKCGPNGGVDLRNKAGEIVAYGLKLWEKFGKAPPDPIRFCEKLDIIIVSWLQAGQPSCLPYAWDDP